MWQLRLRITPLRKRGEREIRMTRLAAEVDVPSETSLQGVIEQARRQLPEGDKLDLDGVLVEIHDVEVPNK